MSRANNGEVAPIEGQKLLFVKAFSGGDNGGIHRSQRKVSVGPGQLRNADPVRREDWFGDQVPGGEIAEKTDFGVWAEPGPE